MKKHELVKRAKQFCDLEQYRFTEPRERVLGVLASSKEPMGAYQILESLSSKKEKINPPTVYRAIDFWNKHGFIHRVESMNAYIACCTHTHHENFCIFICNTCQDVIELRVNELSSALMTVAEDRNLSITRSSTEIYGKCGKC